MPAKITGTHYRQGDVLITRVDRKPDDLEPYPVDDRGRIVLAEGEQTGHSHTIKAPAVRSAFRHQSGDLYLTLSQDTEVIHQEHDSIVLPRGTYRVRHQREYSPQEIRRVAD